MHARLRAALFFDLRVKNGFGGRAIEADLLDVTPPLLRGDRLEPSEDLLDVHAFDAMSTYPFTVKFWRTTIATRLWRFMLLKILHRSAVRRPLILITFLSLSLFI